MKAWKFLSETAIRLSIVLSVVLLAACKQGEQQATLSAPTWSDDRPIIDVESLKDNIDLNMDISQLTVSELRVLRNAFAARQGYLFMEADLRNIFWQTSWYEDRMMRRWMAEDGSDTYWDEETGEAQPLPSAKPISYTKEEQAFIDKLEKREKELMANNFKMDDGWLVNVDNVVNIYQKEGLGWETRKMGKNALTLRSAPITEGLALRSKLAEQGFAIVNSDYDQLFQIYENNDYSNFPNFVTTDLYLQAFHLYFDVVLRRMEESHFIPELTNFCDDMHRCLKRLASEYPDNKAMRELAEHAEAYFAIAHTILTGKQTLDVPPSLQEQVNAELQQVESLEDNFSDFLDYKDAYFMYSLFRPRGHYTRKPELERYFKAMMWLQTAPFCVDKPQQVQEALIIGQTIDLVPALKESYLKLTEPITYLMGQPDNGSIVQVYDLLLKEDLTVEDLVSSPKKQKAFEKKLKKMLKEQVRIKPKNQVSSEFKINLMPQRFMPDALVLQEMVDYDSKPTLRATPKGLDVLAAMGVTAAEHILLDELKEGENWDGYEPQLKKMKKENDPAKWDTTVSNEWMKVLTTLQAERYEKPKADGKHPDYFMCTPQWDKKNLNAALASWAELKHDAILYAKQPMGAECGGGGPDEPICVGYVEPNVRFWEAAIALLGKTKEVFKQFGMDNEDVERYTENLREEAEFFLAVSKKELTGKRLSDEEYQHLEYIGASFENLSLDMVREEDNYVDEWANVQGPDKMIALVADVYTANAFNNAEKSILYEAVGPADEIYVIVEIDGQLYLTRGAVFSYREFTRPLQEQRLTDEEWQKMLKKYPTRGVPTWMEPLKVPSKDIPADNELIFYSTGC